MSVIVLFSVLAMAVMAASAQPTADSFGVDDASGYPGTHVIVPVNLTNATTGPIQAIVFNIEYDKNVINVTDVLSGDLTSNWSLGFNNDFEGGTRVSLVGDSPIPNGSGDSVALLNFSVERTSDSVGYSHMTVRDIQFSNPGGREGTAPARNGLFHVAILPTPTPPPEGGGGEDGAEDTDGDGYSDIDEKFAETDPNDPDAYPGSDAPAVTPAWTTPAPAVTTATATPAPTPTITPAAAAETPQLTWAYGVFIIAALLLIAAGIYYYYVRRRE